MAKECTVRGGLTGVWVLALVVSLVTAVSSAVSAPAPSVDKILEFRPRQSGIQISTPSKDAQSGCKVELVKGSRRGSGWLLKDQDGRPLRRFFDRNGDKRIDVWSYYHNGREVYREIDSSFNGTPTQFRWLNHAGTKWGVSGSDGQINHWKVISPEEVSQEVLRAVMSQDYRRLKSLMISESEIKALGLTGPIADTIRKRREQAPELFKKTCDKIKKLDPKARWLHLETGVPQCVPAEQTKARYDLIRHTHGTLLYELEGGTDWIQTGVMIRVGAAWRIIGAPIPGAVPPEPMDVTSDALVNRLDDNPKLRKLIDQLTEHDKKMGKISQEANPKDVVAHHLERANLLEKIVSVVSPDQRDPWIRQVADSLSTAAQADGTVDGAPARRLQSLQKQLKQAMPGRNLTAYVVYRGMQAEYSAQITTSKDITKVQKAWAKRLAEFVENYPKADDTADALLQLGMVSEFLRKDAEAKKWYNQLATKFPDKRHARKAQGAIRRLTLEGKPLDLSGPLLSNPDRTYDTNRLRGRVVVVYYWASWNSQCKSDFNKMKELLEEHKDKLALVAINLDRNSSTAAQFVRRTSAPGVHLHDSGGMDGVLAADHGIMVLPTIFMADTDGKVVHRNLHISSLEDEVEKLLKK